MHRIHFGSSATHADLIEFKQVHNQLDGGLSSAGGKKNFVGYDACSGLVIRDGAYLQPGFLGQGRCGQLSEACFASPTMSSSWRRLCADVQHKQLSLAWGRCLGDSAREIPRRLNKYNRNRAR